MAPLLDWLRTDRAETPGKAAALHSAPELLAEPPELAEPPIFISGCNRGGTTILARLLGQHPEVCNIGTGPFTEGQYVWRLKFPDRSRHRWAVEPWRSEMRKTAADATPELVRFFRARFAVAAGEGGRLLEKTPANAVRIPFIDRCFPDASFVHVIRDGRDTICSLVARKVPFRDAPLQWVGAHGTAIPDLEQLPAERVTLVRYEELLAGPERVLCEVAERCGLTVDAEVREIFAAAAGAQLAEPVSRWPGLTGEEKRYALGVIEEWQRRLGYPVEA